jgi:hypothetical protein
MQHPLSFHNKEIRDFQEKRLRDLESFRETWVTPEHISLPINVITDDGKGWITVGLLTFYRDLKGARGFTSIDKILMRVLGFCISYIIFTCKERQKVQVVDSLYGKFSSKIPDIVKSCDINEILVKLRLTLVDVFKCEDCSVILWDGVEKMFLALTPGNFFWLEME